jgi:AcrR family transcriptional regulator
MAEQTKSAAEALTDATCGRGRGRPQARSDDETRAIIFEAARHEFVARGYAATSMETVAKHAGVSTKTLYRLIPTKAALFEAMVTDRTAGFVSRVRLRACEGVSDIEAALADALTACGELMLDGDVIALQRVILADTDRFPEVAETFFHKAITPTQNALAGWLRTQQKRGLIQIGDADVAAGMLLGMFAMQPLRAVMFGHIAPPGPEQILQRAKACAALFLQGCDRGKDARKA